MMIDPTATRLAGEGVAYAPQIASAARRHDLDPDLLAAVAAQETGGPGSNAGHNVVGDGGHGRGVFQIDDRWHAFASTPAAMDPSQNADYAAGMISDLLKRYGGNVHAALSAYNSGSPTATGTKTRWSDGSDLGYADSVFRHYEQLTGAPPKVLAGKENTLSSLPSIQSAISANTLRAGSPAGLGESAAAPVSAAPRTISGDVGESPESSAIAELGTLISSIGSLSSQAQSLPLSAPTLPGIPADQGYHPGMTDYLQLAEDSD